MKYHNSFLVIPLFLFSASAMSAVTPKITKISVTPTSAPAGTMFKFTAEINNPLPEGYKVKIAPIGLTGFTTMISDVKNSYALSRAIYTTGKQKYKVVIVNAKNAVQGISKIGTYRVLSAAVSNKAPTLSLVKAETTAITNTAYTVTFNAKDVDGNLSSITMNWGDNSEPETLTATDSKDLTFSHIYTSASSFGWNAFASDKGTPVLNSKSISKIVTVSNPEPIEVKGDIETFVSGSKTFSYTKIANDGSELPKTAKLGTGAKDWACTKDNNTGLIWEVKTDDNGLRDKDWTYSWYDPDRKTNGGISGYENASNDLGGNPISRCYLTGGCNTYNYKNTVNLHKLCGFDNWRIPLLSEWSTLVYCQKGTYDYNQVDPKGGVICIGNKDVTATSINTIYFPNSVQDGDVFYGYWTATIYENPYIAWRGFFQSGFYDISAKSNGIAIMLVRD